MLFSDVTGDNSSFIRTFVNPYHNCSPDAYKFYIEQHMDAIKRVHESRRRRRMELEQDLSQSDFSEPLKDDIRRTLCQKETNYMRQTRVKLDRTNFEKIRTIGIGAFGEVALVQKKDTELIYAMKTLKKSHILEKKQIGHVMAERDILAKAENEWVVKLFFSFQDPENLYFVMEYVPGGDLMNLLVNKGQFDEPLARFYIAELVCITEICVLNSLLLFTFHFLYFILFYISPFYISCSEISYVSVLRVIRSEVSGKRLELSV